MCIHVQPAEAGVKLSSSKSPLRKLIYDQDTDKPSEPEHTGLHIESQVDRMYHNILNSKTSHICHSSKKSHLRVELEYMSRNMQYRHASWYTAWETHV